MMELKIRITTPKGQATGAQKTLRPFLIGSKKKIIKFETYVNEDDSELYWVIVTDLRRSLKINRNITMYKVMIGTILGNKRVNKMIKDEKQKEELRKMLSDQTKIEIIKEGEAQELVEYNKTFWQRMKERFTHKEEE